MSVSREVIANVVGIDADEVRCENCEAMPTFMVCKTWDTLMGVGEFCSLFRPKGEWDMVGTLQERRTTNA